MKLSKNFSLWEFTKSQTADREGIDNFPTLEWQDNLQSLCVNVLQPLRDVLGKGITINSGYRGEALEKVIAGKGYKNWCRKNGFPITDTTWTNYFKRKSHPKGEAADIEIKGMDNNELFEFIKASDLKYDQLIREFYKTGDPNSGWIHISYRLNNRMQAFTRG